MLTISSAAGVRLARAKARVDEACNAIDVNDTVRTTHNYSMAHYEFCQAAKDVADELIADRHHDREGD